MNEHEKGEHEPGADVDIAAPRPQQIGAGIVKRERGHDQQSVDRKDAQSVFKHLGKLDLKTWLEEYEGYEGYGLGELWEKNVLGARP